MRRFLTGSVIFLGVMFVPVAMSSWQSSGAPRPDYRNDPRFHALRAFFHRSLCPAEHLSNVFLEAADAYALDWRLLPSLSFVESGGGKAAHNNNMFGWNSGRARFESASAGIHAVGFTLAHGEAYRGKRLESLLNTYNPNADYARTVKYVMRSIAPSE